MSTNGSAPRRRQRGLQVRRPVALAIGAAATLVIVGVLVAPVVLLTGGQKATSCRPTLVFRGRSYDARSVPHIAQAIATGVGVERGCGSPAQNVDVRTLTGVVPRDAVAVAGESGSVYVRRGVCANASGSGLLACLRRDP